MKLLRPSNVYEESWYLLFFIKLLGLYPIKFHRSRYVNQLCGIIMLLPYYCLYVALYDYTNEVMESMSVITTVAKIRKGRRYMNIILLPMIVIATTRQCDKTRQIFEDIDSVDKNVKFLNINIDYKQCMKTDIVQITTVIFITILFNLMDYYGFLDNSRNYMYVLMWIVDRIPDFVSTIAMCTFAVLINKIKFRYKKINEVLDNIAGGKTFVSVTESSDVNNGGRGAQDRGRRQPQFCMEGANNIDGGRIGAWLQLVQAGMAAREKTVIKLSNDQPDFRLILSKVLVLKLWKALSLLNEAYGFQFKVLTMLYILYLCLHMCVVYICSDNGVDAVDTILSALWGSLDIIKLVYIIHLYRILLIQYI